MSAPYRPGQPQWPDNRPQRPDRPPPIQFQQDNVPPPNKTLQWAMRICGLVVIAVVSGLVWYYITNDDTSTQGTGGEESTAPQPQGGVYQFTAHEDMPEPNKTTDCAEHSYNDIKGFFEETPCDHLTRQLFVTKLDDGRTVYTSVSVVIMRDQEQASELREFTDKEGSGNVSDVVRDGLVKIQGLDRLSKSGGYASRQNGRDVIIIEADFAPKDRSDDKQADEDVLDEVCDDALRMAGELDKDTGTTG